MEEKFKKEGFLHLPGFFSPRELDLVREEAKSVFDRQIRQLRVADMFELFSRDESRFLSCGKQVQHLLSLHRLGTDPRIEQLLHRFGMGFPNICTRPVLYFNHPRLAREEVYWRVGAHQDWRSMQGSLNALVIWVPLTDMVPEIGPLEVVPGSHHAGLLTDRVEKGFGMVDGFGEKEFLSVPAAKGDVILFSAFLVHRSGKCQGQDIRWSCHFRYNDLQELTFLERGYPHPYRYYPSEELITPGFPKKEMVMSRWK